MFIKMGNFPEEVLSGYTVKNRGDWQYKGDSGIDAENYAFLAENTGIDTTSMVRPLQTHSANVSVATGENGGDGILREPTFMNTDGIVTNISGLMLCVFQSDCPPVYLYDPVQHAIGLLHSGRRGTEKNIVANAVDKLRSEYGSKPKDIIAAVGPHICKDCYSVDMKTADDFSRCFDKKDAFVESENGRHYIDLGAAIESQLADAGVEKEKIFVSNLCTLEDERLFSFRGGDGYNSNLAFLMIKA